MSVKAVVTLPSVSVDLKDDVTNTFTIGGTLSAEDVDPTMEAALNAAFANFWNAVPPGATPAIELAGYTSAVISRAASGCRLDLYDTTGKLDGSPHGSPFSSTLWTLGPASAQTALPSEVAYVVTLESTGRADAAVETPDGIDADGLVDRPQQRHTGRLYLGPLVSGASAIVGGIARPSAGLGDTARKAVKQLDVAIKAATSNAGHLGIWSRKDEVIRPLGFVSSDDSFDTQRRRGESPTARTRIAV